VVGDATVDGSETLTSMRQAIHFKDVCGLNVHDTMIYEKVNFANPSTNRYHQMWEYVFVLSKGSPKTFHPIQDKKNLYPNGPWGANTFRKANGKMDNRKIKPAQEMGMRGNVWFGNTAAQEAICQSNEHPAMMPGWLAADHIMSWSNPRDVVLDPFNGSGTTSKAAKELNRQWIAIEINEAYCQLAKERMSQEVFQLS
jgi:site-specific DNA-methyltransferase (adenine-specific)